MENAFERHRGEHDWHSPAYVAEWIDHDVTRDNERRPLLKRMIELAPFARDAEISVLDVGAGYGLVSEVVLSVFPRAHVTLQDYSAPMLEQARRRLASHASRTTYVKADLTAPGWTRKVGGAFDLAVSGLAIHNLREDAAMAACYKAIRELLKPGGIFLDYDLVGIVEGGLATHLNWLSQAGFSLSQCVWEQPPIAIVAAWLPA